MTQPGTRLLFWTLTVMVCLLVANVMNGQARLLAGGTDHCEVFVGELTAAADAPEWQQRAHDLYQLLADHVGPMCPKHVVLGSSPLKDMHVQSLLCLAEAHCTSTTSQALTYACDLQDSCRTNLLLYIRPPYVVRCSDFPACLQVSAVALASKP